jgi:hypothetical protein
MYQNDRRCAEYRADESEVNIAVRIDAGSSDCFSIRDVLTDANVMRFGFRHAASVFVRRRLSEMRDNYISKSPALLLPPSLFSGPSNVDAVHWRCS